MAKRRVYEVDQNERRKMLLDFFLMVSDIKTKKEAENFFKDLLTPSESLMITRRIAIAKMLLGGWNFEVISAKMKTGTNTINSVNRWLFSGFGGYLNEIKKAKNKKDLSENYPKSEWEKLKRKYPAHFLIANLIDKFKK